MILWKFYTIYRVLSKLIVKKKEVNKFAQQTCFNKWDLVFKVGVKVVFKMVDLVFIVFDFIT